MWETVKNVLLNVKEATGIEVPGLPDDLASVADLGSVGDSATTAAEGLTESATGIMDGAAPAVEEAAGSVANATETATTAADAAGQTLPDLDGLFGDGPPK